MNLKNIAHPWWQAENSVLRLSSDIQSHDWGQVCVWPDGIDNPKLSFIRLTDMSFSEDKYLDIFNLFRKTMSSHGYELHIRIPADLIIPATLIKHLAFQGNPLAHLLTSYIPKVNHNHMKLKKVETEQELEDWWMLYSTYPTKEEKLKSPYYPVVKKAYLNGTQFFVLRENGAGIASVAIDQFNGFSNIWGVATREDKKRNGAYKQLISQLSSHITRPYFLQTNVNNILFNYYLTKPSSVLLKIERRFTQLEVR